MHYFAVTKGDSCFCSAVSSGKLTDDANCDMVCSGNPEESCGGYSRYASVYTMIDSLPPSPQKLKEDAIERVQRLESLYSVAQGHSCGNMEGNEVEIEGSSVLAGEPQECKQACLAGRGAENCHGFTFDARQGKCTFYKDAAWGKIEKDAQLSCFFKKGVPLLGVDGKLDLDGTSYYSPPP